VSTGTLGVYGMCTGFERLAGLFPDRSGFTGGFFSERKRAWIACSFVILRAGEAEFPKV
jgi:hypothetical protein